MAKLFWFLSDTRQCYFRDRVSDLRLYYVSWYDDNAKYLNPYNSHLGALQIKVCRSTIRLNATMAIEGASRCAPWMGQRQKNLLDTHNGPDVWYWSADEMKVLDLLCEVGDGVGSVLWLVVHEGFAFLVWFVPVGTTVVCKWRLNKSILLFALQHDHVYQVAFLFQ